jgi:hypothetical protein
MSNYIQGSNVSLLIHYTASSQTIEINDYSGAGSLSMDAAANIDIDWFAGPVSGGGTRTITIDFVAVEPALGMTSEATADDGLTVEQASCSFQVTYAMDEANCCSLEVWSPTTTWSNSGRPKLSVFPKPSTGPAAGSERPLHGPVLRLPGKPKPPRPVLVRAS